MSSSSPLSGLRRIASRYRSKVKGVVDRSYRRVRYRISWKYVANPASKRRFAAHPSHLTPTQQQTVQELKTRGIAIVPGRELGLEPDTWAELRQLVQDFARSDRVRERIGGYAAAAQSGPLRGDDYMVKCYPEGPTLAESNPLLRLGLSDPVLQVVNGYLDLWCKLIYTDAWHTIPIDIGRRVGSQSWHRDPEDRKMVKAYLYLADVDEGAGPMEYIPGSEVGGPYERLWPWTPRAGHSYRYPSEADVAGRIPQAEWLKCTGPEGSMVFCDTSGLHRGGISRTSPRILATWTFVTPAALGSTAQRRFTVARHGSADRLSEAARFALE
jgi:hypothetical protein